MPSLLSGPKFVFLKTAKSQLLMPWLRRVESTRPSSPKPQSAGAEKQLVLTQVIPPGTVTWSVLLSHPGVTFGRSGPVPNPAWDSGVDPPKLNGRGKPFWKVVMPLTPQPETTFPTMPEESVMYLWP